MVAGTFTFYCACCGKRFMGIAAEWMATAFVAPVKCPKCNSWHTRPWSIAPARIANLKYTKIWKYIDAQHTDKT